MKFYKITFSPTGGTLKVADILTGALSGSAVAVDLTDSTRNFAGVSFAQEDVAVIAVPSYGGRVPGPASVRLGTMNGGGARAVLVCVYGNRAYEDTLAELEDIARQAGFRVIAAVAAIAEHSIAHKYAAGRPDEQDRQQLQTFAAQIQEKLSDGTDLQAHIPGNRPYKKAGGSSLVPVPAQGCNSCGLCAAKCPVQAIDPSDPRRICHGTCISCMRCVSICPQSARKVDPAMLEGINTMLSKVCTERKKGELFL